MRKNKKPQFAVVMTELNKTRTGLINEKGERFPHWHAFKIGQVVSLIPSLQLKNSEFNVFFDGTFQQTLRKQDFELLP